MLTIRAGTRRRVSLFLRALGWGIGFGLAFGVVIGLGFRDAPLLGIAFNALGGAVNALLLSAVIVGSEIFLPRTRAGHALERAVARATAG